jgi:hypothetical protein
MSKTNKADAKGLIAALADSLSGIAAARQEARKQGLQMPEDIRQHILRTRRLLREAGLSDKQIDATPGLELEQ